jgi:ribosomal protein L11 methylase PrmA
MLRRYRFSVDPELLDALSGCLFAAGALGLEEETPRSEEEGSTLATVADEELGHKLARAYDEFRSLVQCSFPDFATFPVHTEEIALDYHARWLSELGPVVLLPGLVFCPSSRRSEVPRDEKVLWFGPEAAFGSGDHPTTRLASLALAREADLLKLSQRTWNRLLDIGTGTGVLGLVGLWLGARSAIGTDTSELAVEAARANAALNGFESQLLLHLGTLPQVEGAVSEVVVANIDRATLLQLGPRVGAYLTRGGAFIITGFLDEDVAELLSAYERFGFHLEQLDRDGQWALLHFRLEG